MLGPFLSDYKNNDASILKHCFNNNEQEILDWLDEDDILILDRGFRDAIRAMKQFGFEVAMPHFLNGRKQFSLEEANRNRCVTKVRWIIESGKVHLPEKFIKIIFYSVNGQLKQWKYFSQTIQNSSLRYISNYLYITCALINAYGSRCVKDIYSGAEMATRMLEKCRKINPVQARLAEMIREKMQWKKYDAQMFCFPELTEDDVRNLCFGKKSYLPFF